MSRGVFFRKCFTGLQFYAIMIKSFQKEVAMNILVIDAQGGGIGKQVVAAVKKRLPELAITAIGTNSLATASMLKAEYPHITQATFS